MARVMMEKRRMVGVMKALDMVMVMGQRTW
jgi:hypothetical protein